jgi:hypothetical protein
MFKAERATARNSELSSDYILIHPADPGRQGPWCELFWAEWLKEPDKDEDGLRKFTKAILGSFQEASWRNDYAAMNRILELHDFGYPFCLEEPFLTPFELTLMFMLYILADRHLADGNLEASLHDLSVIDAALPIGDARRQQACMVPRGNSELRLYVLGIRAGCFADPRATPPEVDVARGLANEFWAIADAAFENLKSYGDTMRRNWCSNMALRELELCKLGYKLDHALFADCVGAFNQRYDGDLSLAPPPESYDATIHSSWFWDMEVWKHLHTPAHNPDALQHCMRLREATRRLNYGKEPEACLTHYWERQARDAAYLQSSRLSLSTSP